MQATFKKITEGDNRTEAFVLSSIILVALIIRLYKLDYPTLWLDEATTYSMASASVQRLFSEDIYIETSPPIYYLLQHLWMYFGDDRFTMRVLPTLFGTLTVVMTWALARPFMGSKVALLSALLLATGPMFIHYSREIRSYSMLAFFSTATLACIVNLLHRHIENKLKSDWTLWVLYSISCTIAIHSHNSAILLPVLMVIGAALLIATKDISVSFGLKWVAASSVAVLLFLWWIPVLYSQLGSMMQHFWIPYPTLSVVKSNLLGVYPFPRLLKPFIFAIAAVGLLLIARRTRAFALISILVLAGQPLLLYLISLHSPAFIRRALIWPSVFFYIFLAVAVLHIKIKWARWLFAVTLVAINLYAARDDYPAHRENGGLHGLIEHFKPISNTDVLLIAPQTIEWELRYDFRSKDLSLPIFGLNYADRGQLLKRWMISNSLDRKDARSTLSNYPRLWILKERNPIFPPAKPDDFEPVIIDIINDRKITDFWRGSGYDLYLLE